MQKLLDYVGELERRRIRYRLSHVRDDAVMVDVCVPGWRWEVEFFADGRVEVEGFESALGVLGGPEAEGVIARILREHDEAEVTEGRPPPEGAS